MDEVQYRPVRRLSAAELVRRELIEHIETGDLAVGGKLPSETELARAFGVSRPVIREALGGLRASGVIQSRPGRGSFVASERPTGLLLLGRYSEDELHEVRCHLEIPGVAEAAQRRRPEHCDRLRELIAELEAENDVRRWVTLDATFHICLAEATGNGLQLRLIEDLRDLLVEHSFAAALVPGRIDEANAEHQVIRDAVLAGDADQARLEMHRHLENVQSLAAGDPAPRRLNPHDHSTKGKL
jgi:DNA-binding FadR family transcriptional regulator